MHYNSVNQPDSDQPDHKLAVERYRQILDNLPVGYVYCRVVYEDGSPVDLVHEETNLAYEKLTGFKNVIGRRLTELLPGVAESNPEFFRKLLKVAESRVSDRFESYMPEFNRWYDNVVFSPEKGCLISIIDDITESRLAGEALRESEERLEATIKASGVGIWDWNLQTGIVICNDRWSEMLGYRPEELEPISIQTWIDLAYPEDMKNSRALLAQHFTGESKDYEIEYRMRHKNGQWIWLLDQGKVLTFTEDGAPMRMLGTHTDITERKHVEHQLRKSEERFKKIFNSHSAIQALVDPDTGQILDANQKAADWYGWSIEELRQMYTRDINTQPPEAIIESLKAVTADQQNVSVGCHRRADGSIRNVEIYRNQIDIDGKAVIHVITHDITERSKTEKALLESEERFRSLFEDHSATMLVFDFEKGNIVDANRAAAKYYGWSIEELRRMSILQINILSLEEYQREQEYWSSTDVIRRPYRHRRGDGSIRDVEIFGKKIRIQGTNLVYAIIQDITEQKRLRAQEAIRISLLEKFEKLSIDELLQIALDEIECLTDSSIGFFHLVAKDQNELLLRAYSSNTLANMSQAVVKDAHVPMSKAGVWADAVRERRAVIHNDRDLLNSGTVVPEGHAEVIRNLVVPVIRDNQVMAILGVGNKPSDYDDDDALWVKIVADQVWDIIEKKIVVENYRKIEAQLQHSRKMEMVGQLASGIAHEINNPLNFIQINYTTEQDYFAEFLSLFNDYRNVAKNHEESGQPVSSELQRLRSKEEEIGIDSLVQEMYDIFSESQKGIDRIKKIVEGMRGLSYKHTVDNKVLSDINKGIKETLNIARSEYRFVADVATSLGELPPTPCLPDQINQVLLNLIINSAHAIQSQQRSSNGTISIRTWFDKDNVYCSIEDDGPGMPPAIMADIFNPFFTTKAAGKGTGLGLSISYDIIVNKHNGTITVDCPASGGTVFTISLPLDINTVVQEPHEKHF